MGRQTRPQRVIPPRIEFLEAGRGSAASMGPAAGAKASSPRERGDVGLRCRAAKKSAIPDAMEAARQDVEQKATYGAAKFMLVGGWSARQRKAVNI